MSEKNIKHHNIITGKSLYMQISYKTINLKSFKKIVKSYQTVILITKQGNPSNGSKIIYNCGKNSITFAKNFAYFQYNVRINKLKMVFINLIEHGSLLLRTYTFNY